jgi:hypothetical protein
MRAQIETSDPDEISVLLRGESEPITAWAGQWNTQRTALHIGVIILGAGFYGAALGWWRDPRQALFTAVKFPLIILLTTAGTALLNAMLAPLLGLNIRFRQAFTVVLMSYTITAVMLGAFSPLLAFIVWNAPDMAAKSVSRTTYSFIQLMNIAVIALAGVTGNARLFRLLERLGQSRTVARRVILAWLAGNLFLGSQLSWILRPFVGAPGLPVEFFRKTAFQGNFYEAAFRFLVQIFH